MSGQEQGDLPTPVALVSAVARCALSAALCFIWFVVLLPNTGLARLRSVCPPLSEAISRVERIFPPVDMVHVVLFACLGMLIGMSFARARLATLAWTIAGLAAATELVQVWVPGRSAKVGDFAADIAGGVTGLAVGCCLMRILWRK